MELIENEDVDVKEIDLRNEQPPSAATAPLCQFEAAKILTPESPDLSLQKPQFLFPPIKIPNKVKLQPRVLLHRLVGTTFNKKKPISRKK